MEIPGKKLVVLGLMLSLLTACGITANGMKEHPGYASLSYPASWEARPEVSLSLGPSVLGLAKWAMKDEEPEMYKAFDKVKGVRIRVYQVKADNKPFREHIETSTANLIELGWERIVAVNEDDSKVSVMVKSDAEGIDGMVVLVTDIEEAVFVNIIGDMDTEYLGNLIGHVREEAEI